MEEDWFDEGPPSKEQVTQAKQVLYYNCELQPFAIILFRRIKELEEDNSLHYFDRIDTELQIELRHMIEQIGKRQYFNALRGVAKVVALCTNRLQELLNENTNSRDEEK